MLARKSLKLLLLVSRISSKRLCLFFWQTNYFCLYYEEQQKIRRGGDGFTCLHTINTLGEGSKEMLRDYEGKKLLSSRIFLSHHHICLIISRSHQHSKTLYQPTPGKKHVWQSIVIDGFMGHQDHLLILAVSLLSFSVFVYFVYVSHSLCTLGHKLPITDQIWRSEVKSLSWGCLPVIAPGLLVLIP